METIRILYPAIAEEQNNELNEWNVYRHTHRKMMIKTKRNSVSDDNCEMEWRIIK